MNNQAKQETFLTGYRYVFMIKQSSSVSHLDALVSRKKKYYLQEQGEKTRIKNFTTVYIDSLWWLNWTELGKYIIWDVLIVHQTPGDEIQVLSVVDLTARHHELPVRNVT